MLEIKVKGGRQTEDKQSAKPYLTSLDCSVLSLTQHTGLQTVLQNRRENRKQNSLNGCREQKRTILNKHPQQENSEKTMEQERVVTSLWNKKAP
jgi:hypothetical protein